MLLFAIAIIILLIILAWTLDLFISSTDLFLRVLSFSIKRDIEVYDYTDPLKFAFTISVISIFIILFIAFYKAYRERTSYYGVWG